MPESAFSQLSTLSFDYTSSFLSDASESGWINVENFVIPVEGEE
jgi:hypothetical protein